MSRVGKKPIVLPEGVSITIDGHVVEVKGPKGTLKREFPKELKIELEGNVLTVTRPDDSIRMKELHGTCRANLNNMVVGVSQGFKKELEIVGIGYRAAMRGEDIVLNMGYSHEVVLKPEPGVKISVADNVNITVEGYDAQAVVQTAALIRAVREPEPYKGKGIKYKGEFILRKEGKRAGKK